MQFPMYNIDIPSLGKNYWLLNEIIRYNATYSSNDEEMWKQYFLNMRFVDSQGDVYRLVDKIKIRKLWHSLFRIARYDCGFVATGERLSIEELRQIMESQIINTDEKFAHEFIAGLRKAKTLAELIAWKTVDIERTFASRGNPSCGLQKLD